MERKPVGSPSPPRHGFPGARPLLWIVLMAVLALGLAAPQPASACTEPVSPDIWVIIRGDDIWIIIRGYRTFQSSANAFCACGIQKVSSILSLADGEVVDANTGEVLPQFPFTQKDATSTSLSTTQGGTWLGLLARVTAPVAALRPIIIKLHGKIVPGTSIATVIQQLVGTRIATGPANSDGTVNAGDPHFMVKPPAIVDPAPLAPVVGGVRLSMAPPSAIFTMRDAEDGLRSLEVVDAVNATAAIAHFVPGSRGPVEVTVAQTDEHLPASFALKACNMFQECSVKTAVLLDMKVQETPESHALPGLLSTQSKLYFLNGDPGTRMISFFINGRRFSLRPLIPNQILEGDLGVAMVSGENSMRMVMRGSPGSDGLVLLME